MYRTIIQFKKDTSVDDLLKLKEMAEKAFDNRAGRFDGYLIVDY